MPSYVSAWPRWTNHRIIELVDELNEKGFVALPAIFAPEQVEIARAQGLRVVEANGDETATFDGTAGFEGYLLSGLAHDAEVKQFCRDVFRQLTGSEAPSSEFLQVYRYLAGQSIARHSDYFHFDSYYVTILIPIDLPATGPGRDLILLPNLRGPHQGYLLNAACKFILDRQIVQRLLRRAIDRHITPSRMALEVGKLYMFNDFRSLHTNTRCLPGTRRATLLLHFGNPHHDSRSRQFVHASTRKLTQLIRAVRERRQPIAQ